ncbi:hypothetical protein [Duganella vulcania]|uniref:Uncharacterized protein n=1 Tax=Duganella vulcania TaxID=2692166 RepID=A0A845GJE4_9BURK|nr:hypothetical protein [Duganella vulcania]MYM92779.1 hypothetical protein [Duganella vulcania]
MHIEPSIIPSLIAAGSGIVTALITGLIGKRFANIKALQDKLKLAQSDIGYLLKVEEIHCELIKVHTGESHKLRIRRQAECEGVAWSGQFTPGRVRYSGRQSSGRLFGLFGRNKEHSEPRKESNSERAETTVEH